MSTNVNGQIVTAIRVELARRNLRADALAAIVGLTRSGIYSKMSGRTPFTVAELLAISAAWGVPTSLLLGEPQPAAVA